MATRCRTEPRAAYPHHLAGLLLLLALALPGGAARAAASDWASNTHGAARLITAVEATGSSTQLDVGLQLRLSPGWHTYWRTPGDAGIPPAIDWKGSENLAGATIAWPAPRRLPPLGGLQTYGYVGGVVLPIAVRAGAPRRAAAPARRGGLRRLQGDLHSVSREPRPGAAGRAGAAGAGRRR